MQVRARDGLPADQVAVALQRRGYATSLLGNCGLGGSPDRGDRSLLGYARIPGGAELAYSEVAFRMANGRKIEGTGVIPDVPVPPRLEDLRFYRDRTLEEAQELLGRLTAENPEKSK